MTTLKEHLIIWPLLTVLGLSMAGLMYGIHVYLGSMPVIDRVTNTTTDCGKTK